MLEERRVIELVEAGREERVDEGGVIDARALPDGSSSEDGGKRSRNGSGVGSCAIIERKE